MGKHIRWSRKWMKLAAAMSLATAVVHGVESIAAESSQGVGGTETNTASTTETASKPGGTEESWRSGKGWRSNMAFADPVVRADAFLSAKRVLSWRQGSTCFLQMEGDVVVRVGTYGFRAQRSVVRIDTENPPGGPVHELAFYLDDAQTLTGTGSVKAEGGRFLVTGSTRGKINLETSSHQVQETADFLKDGLAQEAMLRFDRHRTATAMAALKMPADTGPLFGKEAENRRLAVREELKREQELKLAEKHPELATALGVSVEEEQGGALGSMLTSIAGNVGQETGLLTSQGSETAGGKGTRGGISGGTSGGGLGLPDIMPTSGMVSFNADRVVYESVSENESVVALVGNVKLLYQSRTGDRFMTLQAENAVIFLAGDAKKLAEQKAKAGMVRGFYLEDNVIVSDGTYTVRAPRVYYDLAKNKAVLLDAVLYAWDTNKRIPLYVRAEQLRQESRNSFEARQAVVTTTEFGDPHFSIGADRITFKQTTGSGGQPAYHFTTAGPTFTFAHVPVFYWPWEVGGTIQKDALVGVEAGWDGGAGPTFKTRWDMFALLDQQAPQGTTWIGQLDQLGERGPAVGTELLYNQPAMLGKFNGYVLGWDEGNDEIADRRAIGHDGDQRGYFQWQHRQYLFNDWELSFEAAYVSDPTLLEEFFRDKITMDRGDKSMGNKAVGDRESETSVYLKKQEDDWAFTVLGQYHLNDFVPQTPAYLAHQGATMESLPDLGYYRVGTSWWEDRLTYFSQTNVGYFRIRPGQEEYTDRGFANGVYATPEELWASMGITDDWRLGVSSRHEVQAPLKVATVDVTPYAAGEITVLSDDYGEYSLANTGNEQTDRMHVTGLVGTRLHTQFHRTYDEIDWPLLDVHRLRHVIEPNANVFEMIPGVDPTWPIERVGEFQESDGKGYGVVMGLRNTLQTQRGGPGRWYNVDWIVLDTDLIHRSDESGEHTLPRFFDYRPEYSLGGDHFHTHLLWNISDSVATTAELTHDMQRNQTAQYRWAVSIQQTPRLRHELAIIGLDTDAVDGQWLVYETMYQMTKTYAIGGKYVHDLSLNRGQSISVELERKVPGWRLLVVGRHDWIDDEQSIGVKLQPEGFSRNFLSPPGQLSHDYK